VKRNVAEKIETMFYRRRPKSPYPTVVIPRRFALAQIASVEEVQTRVSQVTGKPIILAKRSRGTFIDKGFGACYGLLTRTAEHDLIEYMNSYSPLQTQQIILHELSHIIQHEEGIVAELEGKTLGMGSNVYNEQVEFHAEAMASQLATLMRRNHACDRLGLAQRPLHEGMPWRSVL